MKEIKIKQYINGDTAVSYEDGKKCQKDIVKYLEQCEKVNLDFYGIDYVITAFLNPIIGDLILKYGDEVMKRIGIKNANESIIKKIKLVKDGALVRREDLVE
ncbi:MAG TPA: STAS-like domain-containing protein [Candidatus Fimimorpha faecalis]|uniref:STAS-like domain-containing protein n=1 Tax=Candidatus Fimimorpha faecalis TaxID=2840824 RepID=A0A9D1EGR9_9FIRM|nr:STAS-like domain-containing protein [Candidatus Fimimorpha faecalis]